MVSIMHRRIPTDVLLWLALPALTAAVLLVAHNFSGVMLAATLAADLRP
jgi:hypothetical protein